MPRCEATNSVEPSGAPEAVTLTVFPLLEITAEAVNCVAPPRGKAVEASHENVPPDGTTSMRPWPPQAGAAPAGDTSSANAIAATANATVAPMADRLAACPNMVVPPANANEHRPPLDRPARSLSGYPFGDPAIHRAESAARRRSDGRDDPHAE